VSQEKIFAQKTDGKGKWVCKRQGEEEEEESNGELNNPPRTAIM
jgi:hypothetical protein